MTDPRVPGSAPPRLAEPDEAISIEELRLAARNHGMPLEALRYDLTPVGLHYLLIHYDIPHIEPETWRLSIGGDVAAPRRVSLDELRARPRQTRRVTMECAGNGRARLVPRAVSQPWLDEAVGTAEWTGTPLAPLLREADPAGSAAEVVFTGHDHGIERGVEQDYARSLPLDEALREEVLLAYVMNGQPLLPQHGAPVRLVVPGWYGMAHVKWLRDITVTATPFDGFQNATAYRLKVDEYEPGDPVTRIRPRALMVPPGFPDFMSRTRFVDVGEHLLFGRAWSGWAPVSGVEISADGGRTWERAELGPEPSRHEWRAWSYRWRVEEPGTYQLQARARDAAGNVQPTDQLWNRQGMANNLVQQVTALVRG